MQIILVILSTFNQGDIRKFRNCLRSSGLCISSEDSDRKLFTRGESCIINQGYAKRPGKKLLLTRTFDDRQALGASAADN